MAAADLFGPASVSEFFFTVDNCEGVRSHIAVECGTMNGSYVIWSRVA